MAVVGFGLVTLTLSRASAASTTTATRASLIGLITNRKSQVRDLDAAVRDLRARVDQAQHAAGQRNDAQRAQAALTDLLSLEAGTTAVGGPALVVTLSDSSRPPPDQARASAYRIQDTDLQLVVNALFDAGAEAVAVNQARVVATTPIRGAGKTIVVNFHPLDPPYTIDAIGADQARFESSDIARRFRRWTGLFGLGFSLHHTASVTVPAYDGRVAITAAGPVGSGS